MSLHPKENIVPKCKVLKKLYVHNSVQIFQIH